MPVLIPGLTGTIINVVTVLIGSVIGLIFGRRLTENMQRTVLQGLGLVVLLVGMSSALETRNVLIPLFAIGLGGILGEWLGIEERLQSLGKWLESRFGHRLGETDEGRIMRAFVTASLVYCVGPLTLIGSIQDGMLNDYEFLLLKAVLDGFASIAFAASLGVGVIFSAFTIFIVQGSLSLLGLLFSSALGGLSETHPAVVEMTATGGIIILGIGFILLDIKQIRVANLLPAILLAPLFVLVLQWLGIGLFG